jgi:hypothetical protein
MRFSALCAAAILSAGFILPGSAHAGRTVIDIGSDLSFDGYCSRQQAGIPGGDCEPVALPFALNVGGTSYDSVVVHSNGALSLGSAVDFELFSNSLSDFGVPVFSPLLRNGEGSFDRDGDFVGQYEFNDNQLLVNWFSCGTTVNCFRNNFSLVLTNNPTGFTVDYIYGPNGPSVTGLSGFSLPTGSLEFTGALENRTFSFDANGSLITSAVPEPGTWAMMLLGFGMIGAAMRRKQARLQPA